MANYKRQHWAPQSYLRRFSPDDAHIWVLDKPTDRMALASIRDVAQGKFFNDGFLRDEQGRLEAGIPEGLFEEEFGKWESALGEMTQVALRVAAGGGADLEARRTMATCVAVQLTRTPAFRKRLAEGITGVLEDDANVYLAERMPDAAAKVKATLKFPPEWAAGLHSYFVWRSGQIPEIATDLFYYIWRVGVNRSSVPLCTSDTPVLGYVHDAAEGAVAPQPEERKHDVVRKVLVGDRPMRGIELIFPLTPEITLLMYHPTYFAHMQNAQGRPLALSRADVLHYNALQLLHSERQLYSRDKDFSIVREHAATYTEILA